MPETVSVAHEQSWPLGFGGPKQHVVPPKCSNINYVHHLIAELCIPWMILALNDCIVWPEASPGFDGQVLTEGVLFCFVSAQALQEPLMPAAPTMGAAPTCACPSPVDRKHVPAPPASCHPTMVHAASNMTPSLWCPPSGSFAGSTSTALITLKPWCQ